MPAGRVAFRSHPTTQAGGTVRQQRLSRCAVLSQVLRVPLPPLATPRMLGVDDFALYGETYGTLPVDATTLLPLTLWEGRDAVSLGRWLRQHPGVEVVCRDGSLAYRQGITSGAPYAVQVSDRFHLWQGLSRRVQDIAPAHRGCLAAALPPSYEISPAPVEEKNPPRTPSRTPGPGVMPSGCSRPCRPWSVQVAVTVPWPASSA